MTSSPSTPGRFHAFDSLRAAMMLLGIVFHTAYGYITLPFGWVYKDSSTTPVADVLAMGIHTFRMPLFFVMAGFFTALLVDRRGMNLMLRNRLARVTLPLVLAWIVIVPATHAATMFANWRRSGGSNLSELVVYLAHGDYWRNNTRHLWFLWYLTIFYLAVWLIAPLVRRASRRVRAMLSAGFVRVMGHPLRALVLALPMAVVLWFEGGVLRTSNSFTPGLLLPLGYALFFGFGWALWQHQELLETLPQFAWTQVILSLVLLPLNLAALRQLGAGAGPHVVVTVTGAMIASLMIFGLSGIAVRYAGHERPVTRYLTDASYWMYLLHVPLILIVMGLLSQVTLPAMAKILLVLGIVTPLLLGSYHYLVRDTPIGTLLNGRRYPRRRPK